MGENQNNNNSNSINTKDFVIGSLIGGIVGATMALVLAPKSGKELRGDINQGAHQAKNRASDWKDTAQEKGSDWRDKAYTTGSELRRKAMDSTAQLSKSASVKTKELTNSVKGKLQQRRDRKSVV